ncbi:MAG: alpha/beta hydrolase [Myxococcales bacterium]|nr:alpha/beta hydrolase [Myxococcales bacterium]
MTAVVRSITAADGEPLSFAVHGTAGATPMLTAHGLVSSSQHWQAFVPHFAATRPVVTWDYRGHGGLPAPRAPATISVAQFADDGAAVWRAAAAPPAVVVGLSFGVQVALELWRQHPEAVRALVLICGTPGHPLDRVSASPRLRRTAAQAMRWLGARPALAGRLLAPLRSGAGVRVARELAYLSGGAHRAQCPVEVLEGLFAHVAALAPAVVGEVTAAYFEHSAADVLTSITVPTLIIAGDRDQLTPVATAERMQRAIPGSRLVVFPGHSHLVQVERPADVHATIDAFLADHRL